MADLSMCKSEKCTKRDSCHRVLATPSENQVYMNFPNICRENNGYKWYWETKREIIVKEEGE